MKNRALQNAERTTAAIFAHADESLPTAGIPAVTMNRRTGAMGANPSFGEKLRADGCQRFDNRIAEPELEASDQFDALLDRRIDLKGS
ncbi:MAG: hypothetical protein KMY49_18495 [Hoeflea sp.]|nr:hypothetical protein [Hoeflea sp.]